MVPKDANDRSIPYYHWWPKQGGTEWITYTFPEAATVQTTTIYWFEDQSWGGYKIATTMEYKTIIKDTPEMKQLISGIKEVSKRFREIAPLHRPLFEKKPNNCEMAQYLFVIKSRFVLSTL